MFDSDDYVTVTRPQVLRAWVLAQMLRGAGWAAIAVLAVVVTLGVIYGVGLLLPEESRETPPPMGALAMPVDHIA